MTFVKFFPVDNFVHRHAQHVRRGPEISDAAPAHAAVDDEVDNDNAEITAASRACVSRRSGVGLRRRRTARTPVRPRNQPGADRSSRPDATDSTRHCHALTPGRDDAVRPHTERADPARRSATPLVGPIGPTSKSVTAGRRTSMLKSASTATHGLSRTRTLPSRTPDGPQQPSLTQDRARDQHAAKPSTYPRTGSVGSPAPDEEPAT